MKLRIRILLALMILLGFAALALWWVSRTPPTWYQPPNPRDQRVVALADEVEYTVLEQSQKIRPPEDRWTLHVRESEINAWLSARLPQWIAHQYGGSWPQQLGTPQVHLEQGSLSVALPIESGLWSRTIVARLTPRIVQARLNLEIDRLAFGGITLPGEPLHQLLDLLNQAAPELMQHDQVQVWVNMLSQQSQNEPIFELSDGRRVRLLDIQLRDGIVDITAETLEEEAFHASPGEVGG